MSVIKINNITNLAGGIPTVKGQQLIPTAWVNFNGTSTVAIRDSENVSSISDLGTGNYQINFATAMANTNYAIACSASDGGITNSDTFVNPYNFTTAAVKIGTNNNSGVLGDRGFTSVLAMGGQA